MARMLLRRLAENAAVMRLVELIERLDTDSPQVLRVLTYHRVPSGSAFREHVDHLARNHAIVSATRVLDALEGGQELPSRSVLLTFDDAYRDFAETAWPILRHHGFPAVLFVPTAYPDGALERFWWDRLEHAFERTARREPLPTPLGPLPLSSPAERARAHAQVKRHVKDLAHVDTLATTDAICRALGVPSEPHDVLGWEELRALARQGLTVGAHTCTHPRLDRIAPEA